jgi:hypothetical protein
MACRLAYKLYDDAEKAGAFRVWLDFLEDLSIDTIVIEAGIFMKDCLTVQVVSRASGER